MATRFRLTSSTTAPAVSPSLQSYSHNAPTTVRRKLNPKGNSTADTSALSTNAYTPDGADHIAAGDALHTQLISERMAAGVQFNNAQTIKMAMQCLEAHTNNNLFLQLFVAIVSSDGTTVRRTLRSKVLDGTELATTLTNRFHSTTQDGASYTTVDGDRILVEISVSGTPVATSQVQGHNASLRWGAGGAGGDLAENDTDTGTTLNPWIEFVPDVVWLIDGATVSATVINAGTAGLVVAGANVSDTQIFAGVVAAAEDSVTGAHVSATQTFAGFLAQVVDGAHVSATQVFAGSAAVTVTGATIPSGSQVFAGASELGVAGAHVSGTQVFSGTVSSDVTGAFVGPTATPTPGSIGIAVSGAHAASTQTFAGTVTAGGAISGAFVSSTQIFAGSIALAVSGVHVSTTTVFAGANANLVEGAHVGPTATTFVGAVTVAVDGATVPSGSQVFAGTVATSVVGAHIPSGSQAFGGSVSFPGLSITGAFVADTQIFAGDVNPVIEGAFVAGTQIFPGFAGIVPRSVTHTIHAEAQIRRIQVESAPDLVADESQVSNITARPGVRTIRAGS